MIRTSRAEFESRSAKTSCTSLAFILRVSLMVGWTAWGCAFESVEGAAFLGPALAVIGYALSVHGLSADCDWGEPFGDERD